MNILEFRENIEDMFLIILRFFVSGSNLTLQYSVPSDIYIKQNGYIMEDLKDISL